MESFEPYFSQHTDCILSILWCVLSSIQICPRRINGIVLLPLSLLWYPSKYFLIICTYYTYGCAKPGLNLIETIRSPILLILPLRALHFFHFLIYLMKNWNVDGLSLPRLDAYIWPEETFPRCTSWEDRSMLYIWEPTGSTMPNSTVYVLSLGLPIFE